MFPDFEHSWIHNYNVWKARYAQPVPVCNYRDFIPSRKTPINGLYLSNMTQIYPEDRGTNYAVSHGRQIGRELAAYFNDSVSAG